MARRQGSSSGSSSQRSQGAGRTRNSEPRVQVFRDFGGCNFDLSPRDFKYYVEPGDDAQTDLQMNFFAIQNNAKITSNKTIETRNNLVLLANAPTGCEFTGVAIIIGDQLYAATWEPKTTRHNGAIYRRSIEGGDWYLVEGSSRSMAKWESLYYGDGKLIALSSTDNMWYADMHDDNPYIAMNLQRPQAVADPAPLTFSQLSAQGTLQISETMTQDCPYRVMVAYTAVNIFGPTNISDNLTFFTNTTVDQWHSGCYLKITGTLPNADEPGTPHVATGLKAIELYYCTDNGQTPLFAKRIELPADYVNSWTTNWIGTIEDMSAWSIANLTAPTKNCTRGVSASRMTMIDGRFYFWGDDEQPYRLWIGGNPGNLLSVSTGTGGGYADVDPGSGQEIRVVTKYKTQSGNQIVTILTDSKNSTNEKRHNLLEDTVSLDSSQAMKGWSSEHVSGAVGCKSYDGAVVCEDGLYSVSRYGIALTTMTMEYNSQIKTTYISDPIKPVFTDKLGVDLRDSMLLHDDGIIYYITGHDEILFCYDVDQKVWWTYTLDGEEEDKNLSSTPIIRMMHIDYEGRREGIGLIMKDRIMLLPTTDDDNVRIPPTSRVLMETGELSTAIPIQGLHRLTQIEFRFNYFVGDLNIELIGIDKFGRKQRVLKKISHNKPVVDLTEWMRIDMDLESYKLRFSGSARFRLTHFMSKVYTKPKKINIVYGFDDSHSYRSDGDIHPTFDNYNDIKRALIP